MSRNSSNKLTPLAHTRLVWSRRQCLLGKYLDTAPGSGNLCSCSSFGLDDLDGVTLAKFATIPEIRCVLLFFFFLFACAESLLNFTYATYATFTTNPESSWRFHKGSLSFLTFETRLHSALSITTMHIVHARTELVTLFAIQPVRSSTVTRRYPLHGRFLSRSSSSSPPHVSDDFIEAPVFFYDMDYDLKDLNVSLLNLYVFSGVLINLLCFSRQPSKGQNSCRTLAINLFLNGPPIRLQPAS